MSTIRNITFSPNVNRTSAILDMISDIVDGFYTEKVETETWRKKSLVSSVSLTWEENST